MSEDERCWTLTRWDLEVVKALAAWPGDSAHRTTFRRIMHDRIVDPDARRLRPGKSMTSLSCRIAQLIVGLERAGLVRREDLFILILDRAGLSKALSAGMFVYARGSESGS